MKSFPVLETERLLLRSVSMKDNKEVLLIRSSPSVNHFIQRAPTSSLKDAEEFIQKIISGGENGGTIYWIITMKDSDVMIGSICLWNFSPDRTKAELGYELDPAFQQQGIMSEAMKCVLDFGLASLKLDKIEAFTHYGNKASKRLLEKNGFKLIEGKKDMYNEDNIVFVLRKM